MQVVKAPTETITLTLGNADMVVNIQCDELGRGLLVVEDKKTTTVNDENEVYDLRLQQQRQPPTHLIPNSSSVNTDTVEESKRQEEAAVDSPVANSTSTTLDEITISTPSFGVDTPAVANIVISAASSDDVVNEIEESTGAENLSTAPTVDTFVAANTAAISSWDQSMRWRQHFTQLPTRVHSLLARLRWIGSKSWRLVANPSHALIRVAREFLQWLLLQFGRR